MHKCSTQIKYKFIRTCIVQSYRTDALQMNLGFLDNENRLFSYKDEEYDDKNDLSLHLYSTPIASRLFNNSELI